MKKKVTAKKVVSIIVNIVLYAFFAVCLCALIFCLLAKRGGDDAMSLFGKQMRIVVSGSMEKCDQTDVSGFKIKDIPVKSMVFIDLVPEDEEEAKAWYDELKVGDVLTFRYVFSGSQETVTHRITEIADNGYGGYNISLQGDNKNSTDNVGTQYINTSQLDSPNYVIGRVTGQSKVLGWILYNLRQPVGLVLIIIIPCAIIIIMQVIRIVNVVSADKKKKAAEEQEKKDDEIEELKRKLSELQQAQATGEGPPPPHGINRVDEGLKTERSNDDKTE